jgi:hypothetical protein
MPPIMLGLLKGFMASFIIKGLKIILTNKGRGVFFSGVVQRAPHRPIPAQWLSGLGVGHSPKRFSGLFLGLFLIYIQNLARQRNVGVEDGQPRKKRPLGPG